MKQKKQLTHEFVEYIPEKLKEGTIYVSMVYATAAHKCCCGCGNEVVTPLSPTDWKLFFDGQSISLDPSIGNWNFTCQSHYWIKHNKVKWVRPWSQEEICIGRARDSREKKRYFNNNNTSVSLETIECVDGPRTHKLKERFWQRLKNCFGSLKR